MVHPQEIRLGKRIFKVLEVDAAPLRSPGSRVTFNALWKWGHGFLGGICGGAGPEEGQRETVSNHETQARGSRCPDLRAAQLPDLLSKDTPHHLYSQFYPVLNSMTSVQQVFPLSPAFVVFLPSLGSSSQHTHMPGCLLSNKTKTHCYVAIVTLKTV